MTEVDAMQLEIRQLRADLAIARDDLSMAHQMNERLDRQYAGVITVSEMAMDEVDRLKAENARLVSELAAERDINLTVVRNGEAIERQLAERSHHWHGEYMVMQSELARITEQLAASQAECGRMRSALINPFPEAAPTDRSDGWDLDYGFLERLTEKVQEYGEEISQEAVQAVLLVVAPHIAALKHADSGAVAMSNQPLDDLEMFELLQAAYPEKFPDDENETWEAAMQFVDEISEFDILADLLGRVVMLTMPMESGLTKRLSHCLGKVEIKAGRVDMIAAVRRDAKTPDAAGDDHE